MLPLIVMLPLLYSCSPAKPSPTQIKPLPPPPFLYSPFVQFFLPFLLFPFCLWHAWGIITISRVIWGKNRPRKTRKTISDAAGIHQTCAFWHVLRQRHNNPLARWPGYSRLGEKMCARDVMCKVELESFLVSIKSQLLTNPPKPGSAMGINCASPVLCQWRLWCDSTRHPVYLNMLRYYSHVSFFLS